MVSAVAMPRLGMSMKEGTVVSWPLRLGDPIEKGQIVVVIESEKTEFEVEATAAGVLRHIYVPEGETVPCGTLLAATTTTTEEPFDAEAFRRENDRPLAPAQKPASKPERAPRPSTASSASPPGSRRPVAPAARALARKLGVELDAVAGTGPGGRVVKEDVEAWVRQREGRVQVAAGVHLEVLRDGSGEPAILLPGFGTDVSSLSPQARLLAESHLVLGVNPHGVGLSDAPVQDEYLIETAADDVAGLSQAPAHVIGASLGAAVAIELALRHPSRVRTLTLLTPFVTASARLLAVLEGWCRVAQAQDAEILTRSLLPWLFSEDLLADAARRERTARGLKTALGRIHAAALERWLAGLRRWSGSRCDALAKISAPTLVVAAGADLLTPGAEEVGSRIPGAKTVSIDGAGHAVAIEAAEQVNQLLAEHVGE
jgi:pimeloyl-ACP methyl ester carboxylesterase